MNKTELTIRKFVRNLGYRFNSENRISDLTFSLLKSSDLFLQLFCKFIFDLDISENLVKDEITIKREYSNIGNSNNKTRVDLYLKIGKNKYIVENKLWNTYCHELDYFNTFKDYTRAIIALYDTSHLKDYYHFTKTWQDFIKFLNDELIKLDFNIDKVLIDEYCKIISSKFPDCELTVSEKLNNLITRNPHNISEFFIKLKALKSTSSKDNFNLKVNKELLMKLFDSNRFNKAREKLLRLYENYSFLQYTLFSNYDSLEDLKIKTISINEGKNTKDINLLLDLKEI